MKLTTFAFTAIFLVGFFAIPATGQNLFLDYGKNAPSSFSPSDAWERGVVFRNQIGHGGLFYNCDEQEGKRFSPYITWCGPTPDRPCIENLVKDWRCQLDEVKKRVRWGRGCDVPAYDVPWLPASRYGYEPFADAHSDKSPKLASSKESDERLSDASDQSPAKKGILR